ncbi:MAG: hypothetical protein ACXVEE_39150, partial [Polyangiales bacterium]
RRSSRPSSLGRLPVERGRGVAPRARLVDREPGQLGRSIARGVLLAGGAVLVLTDKSGSANGDSTKDKTAFRLEVRPTVTTTGSSLSLVGQF